MDMLREGGKKTKNSDFSIGYVLFGGWVCLVIVSVCERERERILHSSPLPFLTDCLSLRSIWSVWCPAASCSVGMVVYTH